MHPFGYRSLVRSVLVALALLAASAGASIANTVDFVVTSAPAGAVIVAPNYVLLDPNNIGPVTFDLVLNNTTGISGFDLSGEFDGSAGTVTATRDATAFFTVPGYSPLFTLGGDPIVVDGNPSQLIQWAFGAQPVGPGVPVGIFAGCGCTYGTLTVNLTSTLFTMDFGILRDTIDGAGDNYFNSVNGTWQTSSLTVALIPEPGTGLLTGIGIALMAARRERRR